MAHRLLRDTEADGWERSDFPIICESCLGANPYVRMTKANFDKECKVCTRPFTVFRWRPGRDARYKKTEVCQTCCKLKNVCQVCLLDLEYGLPVQARDTALGIDTTDAIPKSDVNKEFFAEEHDRKAKAGLDFESSYGKMRANDTILKLQRTGPYYKRNRAHICSFFVRGDCTRGAECPYRHEMPTTGELAEQNIKDRYYGVNDPVAKKLLRRAAEMPSLDPPEDTSIRTLYVGGLDGRVTEKDLKDQFYGYGELESIRVVPKSACAFVTYTTREGAEKAALNLAHKLLVKGLRLRLLWGRPQEARDKGATLQEGQGSLEGADGAEGFSQPGEGGAGVSLLPRSLQQGQGEGVADLGPSSAPYPSMNPERMGSAAAQAAGGGQGGERAEGGGQGTEGEAPPRDTAPAAAGYHPRPEQPPQWGEATTGGSRPVYPQYAFHGGYAQPPYPGQGPPPPAHGMAPPFAQGPLPPYSPRGPPPPGMPPPQFSQGPSSPFGSGGPPPPYHFYPPPMSPQPRSPFEGVPPGYGPGRPPSGHMPYATHPMRAPFGPGGPPPPGSPMGQFPPGMPPPPG